MKLSNYSLFESICSRFAQASFAPRVLGRTCLKGVAPLLALWLLASCSKVENLPTPAAEQNQSAATFEIEQGPVRVVTSGGFAAAFDLLRADAEESLNISIVTEYGSSSGGSETSIPKRLRRGEKFDLIILSKSSLKNMEAEGYVAEGGTYDLVRSKIGMAVKSGAPHPNISSEEKFIQVLQDAESIGYSASASGTYLSTVLWPKMGLWESLKGKSTRVVGDRVATIVARGELEIGFQQISEILPIEGADYVGPIPESLQKTTTFSIGLIKNAEHAEAAKNLVDYLTSKTIAAQIAETGLSPVALEEGEN